MNNRFYQKYIKRGLDIVSSLGGLIVLSPVLLLISAAIKIDSDGPVIFKQKRLGEHGEEFLIYKFRTMVVNAEHQGDGLSVKSENDERITDVGKFLRKTSLDELPQLVNVLEGDMSIVGPRPPVTYFPYKIEDYPQEYLKRFKVKPGITGLAQVEVRNNATWHQRFEFDLKYINQISFLQDINIIKDTIFSVLKPKNIYGIHKEKEHKIEAH